MSASKEIKSRLKAAKAAVDEKDYEKTLKQCQRLFQLDPFNYNGQVFAGLACLQLGQYEESKRHYKGAITQQPDGPLAWKGLADYYDKHRAVTQEEQLDAIETYTNLLKFIESNVPKMRSTLQKLIALHKEFHHDDNVLHCYSQLVHTIGSSEGEGAVAMATQGDDIAQIWIETTSYLLGRKELSTDVWTMLEKAFHCIPEYCEQKAILREKFVRKSFTRFMLSESLDAKQKQQLEEECSALISTHPHVALPKLAYLGLVDIINSLCEDLEKAPLTLLDTHKEWFTQHHSVVVVELQAAESGEANKAPRCDGRDVALGWAGLAAVQVAEGKWKEANSSVETAVEQSDVPSECWLISAYVHLRLRDYQTADRAVRKGITAIPKSAKFLKTELEFCSKLLQCKACLGLKDKAPVQEALAILLELGQVKSCDLHVTTCLVKAYLLQEDIQKASEALQRLTDHLGADHFQVLVLQAEIQLAQQDYPAALSSIDSALSKEQGSPLCLFVKGNILWRSDDPNKKPAYVTLLQAAKADPLNPEVFLLLGHYQRQISKDLKRAVKCYQKVLDLQPVNTEAAICLGDVLTAIGEEDEAFEVYSKVVSSALISKAKFAWLRMGLYQRKKGQYSEAIKSFQNVLAADPNDRHCWECLGEAYFARGSYNSALRTFNKILEMEPNSLYCLYQIACIKQLLGELQESVSEFSAVLEMEPSYVPALKGRGESHLLLCKQALQQNFDGKAVDHTSLALSDLVKAVKLSPQFTCLWKLIGDSLTSLHVLADDIARPRVPKVLCGESPSSPEESKIVDKKEALYIGCRAYANAIQLSPESALFWHDLAVGYLYLGQATKKEDPEREQNFTNAVNAIKKAISLDVQNHHLWNTFGVIAATPEINNPALAQHAFIKSIQEERNNAIAWANLGALYLTHDNIKLAHEAFKNAQSLAPDCVEAWIGQAMIAESIGDSEAMDLFRHSTELGYHPEGSIGYGFWVCQSLGTIDPKLILIPGQGTLNSIALTGMLQARDCLQKHALREKDDACALNYLGLLHEQEGLLKEAEKAFSSALKEVSSNNTKAVCMIKDNYARVLSTQGKLSEALEHLQSLPLEDDITFQFELALALYRKLKFTESGQVYQQLFDHVATTSDVGTNNSKSTVLTAQAMVAFAQGNHDGCKTLLFKAFQTPPVSVHGLVALCTLGCVTSNLTLVQAALMEIDKILESMTEVLHPSCIDVLNVILFILQDNSQAQECVQTLKSILGRLPNTSSNEQMPLPLPLMLHALKRSGADKATLRAAVQKLVHAYPTDVWTLAMLISLLEQAQDLKVKYRQLVTLHIEDNLSQLSAKEVRSPVDKSYQASLLSLQQWAAAT